MAIRKSILMNEDNDILLPFGSDICSDVETETTASKSYTVGKWFYSVPMRSLCRVTAAIASGETITNTGSGANVEEKTLEEFFGEKLDKTNIANNLTTTAAGSVLDARQGKALSDKIGSETLATTAKNCIGAINELLASFSSALTNLKATAIAKAVGATSADNFQQTITKLGTVEDRYPASQTNSYVTIQDGSTRDEILFGPMPFEKGSSNRRAINTSAYLSKGYYRKEFRLNPTITYKSTCGDQYALGISIFRRGNGPRVLFNSAGNDGIYVNGTSSIAWGGNDISSGTNVIPFYIGSTAYTFNLKFDYDASNSRIYNFRIENTCSNRLLILRQAFFGRVTNSLSGTSYWMEGAFRDNILVKGSQAYYDLPPGFGCYVTPLPTATYKYIQVGGTWTYYGQLQLSIAGLSSSLIIDTNKYATIDSAYAQDHSVISGSSYYLL